jgi:hypothetical protein
MLNRVTQIRHAVTGLILLIQQAVREGYIMPTNGIALSKVGKVVVDMAKIRIKNMTCMENNCGLQWNFDSIGKYNPINAHWFFSLSTGRGSKTLSAEPELSAEPLSLVHVADTPHSGRCPSCFRGL